MKSEDEDAIIQLACALGEKELDEFLVNTCAGDEELRKRLEHRLAEEADAETILDSRAGPDLATGTVIGEQPGNRIGPYTLVEKLGVGGMGAVWKAEQEKPVKRTVALKIIKAGMDSAEVIARFEAERQALAMMDHPNIAQAYEAGATETGRPYFVMELVNGIPITKYCDEQLLNPRERLALFIDVCNGLQHAHQKGVIHRDIKPSNILVAVHDGKPVPKLIDFGIAKATGQSLTDRTLVTHLGQMMGTPVYMSPEQASGKVQLVDTRSDVYALGVLLYELLTGNTPIDPRELKKAGFAEMQRMVAEADPPRPSTRMATSAEDLPEVARVRRVEPPAKLGRMIKGDLDWIVMRSLEKEPERRYVTVRGFAADIERYLKSEPVEACPPSTVYRLRKFARRNRQYIWAAGFAAAALLSIFLLGLYNQAQERKQEAGRLFDKLFETEIGGLQSVVEDLRPHYDRLKDDLRTQTTNSNRAPRKQARARLVLAPRDPGQLPELSAWLLTSDPDELATFVRLLEGHEKDLAEAALAVIADEGADRNKRLRAAAICASVGLGRSTLRSRSGEISGWLTNRSPYDAGRWLAVLDPIKADLLSPLERIFDREADTRVGEVAALALAAFRENETGALIDLARKSSPRQLWPVVDKLLREPAKSKAALVKALDEGLVATPRPDLDLARLGIVLLQMKIPDPVWPLLQHDPIPDLRTNLIHGLAEYDVDWPLLTERLAVETDPGILGALLLALGDYNLAQLPLAEQIKLRGAPLESLYATHPDTGVRSAARWLITQWLKTEWESDESWKDKLGNNLAASLNAHFAALDEDNRTGAPLGSRRWYATRQPNAKNGLENDYFTMSIVHGPVTFMMGSPKNEPDRRDDEELQEITLKHSFALATSEVPRELFDFFLRVVAEEDDAQKAKRDKVEGPGSAATHVSLREAMMFCRWFSEREGVPEEEQCYVIDPASGNIRTCEGWLLKKGYRLPTEAEWEYSCRAGTTTSRFFGSNSTNLKKYAWYDTYVDGSQISHISGKLRPNSLGHFDILGNVAEWCQEPYDESYQPHPTGAVIIAPTRRGGRAFVYRGGSVFHPSPKTRSAWRGPFQAPRFAFSSIRLATTVTAE